MIDKKWVLSAAHCFEYSGSYPQLRVVLGEFDTENEEGNEVLMKVRMVSTKILALGVWAYLRLFSDKGGFSGWYGCKEAGGVHVEAGTELREKKTTTPARDLLGG